MLKELYVNLKKQYPETVALIKSGTFYITFDDDAKIMNILFDYQISNSKIGFPIKNLNSKIESLNNNNLQVVVKTDDIITEYKVDKNDYIKYVTMIKNNAIITQMTNNLIPLINSKLKKNMGNYNIIMEFLNEL